MKIGHITLVRRGTEKIVKPIEQSGFDEWDDSRQRQKSLREAEEKYRREIAKGAKLRLYNKSGYLVTEVD